MLLNHDNISELPERITIKFKVKEWPDVQEDLISLKAKLDVVYNALEDLTEEFFGTIGVLDAYKDSLPDGAQRKKIQEHVEAMIEQRQILDDLDLDEVYRSFESLLDEDEDDN